MGSLFVRIPLILELFFNGLFIVLFSLRVLEKYPFGFLEGSIDAILRVNSYIIPFIIFISMLSSFIYSDNVESFFRKHIFSILIFIPLLMTISDLQFVFWLSSVFYSQVF